jgi:hypothetical protein
VSIDNVVTQQFNEEYPRRCQVPSHETPHLVIEVQFSSCNSLAASSIVFIATDVAAFDKAALLALYAL